MAILPRLRPASKMQERCFNGINSVKKMSNSIQRDQQRRALFSKYEGERLHYKCAIKNLSIAAATRAECVHRLHKISRNSSLTRVRNRCVLSGRGRAVNKFFKLSRIKCRELASRGLLMGVYKSSW